MGPEVRPRRWNRARRHSRAKPDPADFKVVECGRQESSRDAACGALPDLLHNAETR